MDHELRPAPGRFGQVPKYVPKHLSRPVPGSVTGQLSRRPSRQLSKRLAGGPAAVLAGIVGLSVAPVAMDGLPGASTAEAGSSGVAVRAERPARWRGHVETVRPGADLRNVLQRLHPGDTLLLEPGTYTNIAPGRRNPNVLRPVLRPGTTDKPIRVTAADPTDPPLIVGAAIFDRADHWLFSHLRFLGTVYHQPTLVMNGGDHWVVASTEVTGARETGALANLAVEGQASRGMTPTHWQLAGNCIHSGGDRASRPGMMHEIYVTASGASYGRITDNVLFDTPDGAAVKIGDGGRIGAVGASYVTVSGNTMVDNGRHVLLFGAISGINVTHNLMFDATYRMSDHRTRPAIYVNRVIGTSSVIRDNYIWHATRPIFDLQSTPGSWANGGGNGVRRDAPQMVGHGCGLRPAEVTAVVFHSLLI